MQLQLSIFSPHPLKIWTGHARLAKIENEDLLRIRIVGAAPFIITGKLTTLRVRTGNRVREENSAGHAWHYHNKHGKDFQKSRKYCPSSGLNVVLSSQGALDKNLKFKSNDASKITFHMKLVSY